MTAELVSKLREIYAFLPQVRPVFKDGGWCGVAECNGYAIVMSIGKGRYEFSAHADGPLSDFSDCFHPIKKITVASTKTPEQIAKDLKNRLLDPYVGEAVQKARDAFERRSNRQTAIERNITALIEMSGGTIRAAYNSSNDNGKLSIDLVKGSGSIQVSEDYVSMNLYSIPIEMAFKIAALFKGG